MICDNCGRRKAYYAVSLLKEYRGKYTHSQAFRLCEECAERTRISVDIQNIKPKTEDKEAKNDT